MGIILNMIARKKYRKDLHECMSFPSSGVAISSAVRVAGGVICISSALGAGADDPIPVDSCEKRPADGPGVLKIDGGSGETILFMVSLVFVVADVGETWV